MAWNRPNGSNKNSERVARENGANHSFCLVAGLLTIIALVAALIYFTGSDEEAPKTERARQTEKVVRTMQEPPSDMQNDTPVQVPAAAVPRKRPVLTPEEAQAALAARRAAGEKIHNLSLDAEGKPRFKLRFHNPAEREIERILIHRPGEPMFGVVPYNKHFEQKFMESLANKVEIAPDDTPADIEIKEAVEATKKEIAERIKNGESLKEILEESRKEIDRLARYRTDMMKMIRDARNDETKSEEYVGDMIDAANKMLSENGMRPVSKSIFMRRAVRSLIDKANRSDK